MKFKKEDLQDLAYGDHDTSIYEVIENDIIDTARWSNIYGMVFKFNGKFYLTSYSVGATEYQDESPYEYDPDEIECIEVKPVKVEIVQYKAVEIDE